MSIICIPVKTDTVTIDNLIQFDVLIYLNQDAKRKDDVKVSYISLDMGWIKPGRGEGKIVDKWHKLRQDENGKYYFRYEQDQYGLHDEVIEMVRSYQHKLVEDHLLSDESETKTK